MSSDTGHPSISDTETPTRGGPTMLQRHRFDPVSFVFGALFIALAAAVALPADPLQLYFQVDVLAWVVPIGLVAVGTVLLVPALTSARRDEDTQGPQSS